MEGIYHDKEYYQRSLDIYMKISNRFEKWIDWMDSFFANQVLSLLEESISRSDGVLRMIGIGSGSGDLDHDLVSRLATRYSKISNTVLEPTDSINQYKTTVEKRPLSGVEWVWRQQTFDAFYQLICETAEIPKFHFISAFAVLYYMQGWKEEVLNMYNLLESGGVLMIALLSETSGFWQAWERFPMLANSVTIQINSSHVKAFLKGKQIDFVVVKQSSFVDITRCSNDEDEEGSILLDFISHVKNFKATAPPKLRSDFINYIFSEKCSHRDMGRIFLDTSLEAIIIRKC